MVMWYQVVILYIFHYCIVVVSPFVEWFVVSADPVYLKPEVVNIVTLPIDPMTSFT